MESKINTTKSAISPETSNLATPSLTSTSPSKPFELESTKSNANISTNDLEKNSNKVKGTEDDPEENASDRIIRDLENRGKKRGLFILVFFAVLFLALFVYFHFFFKSTFRRDRPRLPIAPYVAPNERPPELALTDTMARVAEIRAQRQQRGLISPAEDAIRIIMDVERERREATNNENGASSQNSSQQSSNTDSKQQQQDVKTPEQPQPSAPNPAIETQEHKEEFKEIDETKDETENEIKAETKLNNEVKVEWKTTSTPEALITPPLEAKRLETSPLVHEFFRREAILVKHDEPLRAAYDELMGAMDLLSQPWVRPEDLRILVEAAEVYFARRRQLWEEIEEERSKLSVFNQQQATEEKKEAENPSLREHREETKVLWENPKFNLQINDLFMSIMGCVGPALDAPGVRSSRIFGIFTTGGTVDLQGLVDEVRSRIPQSNARQLNMQIEETMIELLGGQEAFDRLFPPHFSPEPSVLDGADVNIDEDGMREVRGFERATQFRNYDYCNASFLIDGFRNIGRRGNFSGPYYTRIIL